MYSKILHMEYDSDDSDCTSLSSNASLTPSTTSSTNSEEFELFNRLLLHHPSKLANKHSYSNSLNYYHYLQKHKKKSQNLICKIFFIMLLSIFSILTLVFFTSVDLIDNGHQQQQQEIANETYQINLDPQDKYHLFWNNDFQDESIVFELRLKTKNVYDWFAFGFSSYGSIKNADFCVLWFDRYGKMHFEDIKTDNESIVIVQPFSQDCQFIKARRQGKIVRFAFRRSYDTCDPDDYVIDRGTTHLVYATGTGPISRLDGVHLDSHEHGFQRIQLIKNINIESEKLIHDTKTFEATNGNITVPDEETTYWCRLFKFPEVFRKKVQIVQYEAIISPGSENLAHHMELFHCEVNATQELKAYSDLCSKIPDELKPCKRVTAAWAYGAGPMIYPKNVGLPVGGDNYSLYVMLEMHYNNPAHIHGQIDNSGIRIYYTEHLRPVDAGILEIGLEYTDKNSIPPQTEMTIHGHCVAECTRAGLPPYGINIFASQLHTHLTGVSSYTMHVRGGIELPELNRDNHYSPHYQEIRRLPRTVTVFPGDALIHACVYKTSDRVNMTLGGFGIRDEMCVNYIHYYPKTNLEVCKSSIDTSVLNAYFERLRIEELQNTSKTFPVSDNYFNIHWNQKRIRDLDRLYRESPLSMQCNQSSGQRFPGYWNGIQPTKIVRKRKISERKCRITMGKNSGDGQEYMAMFGRPVKYDTSHMGVNYNTFSNTINPQFSGVDVRGIRTDSMNNDVIELDGSNGLGLGNRESAAASLLNDEQEIDLELFPSDTHTSGLLPGTIFR